MENTLFFGDNLKILTGHDGQGQPYIAPASVDLVYLDPPFNSNRSYNVLFKDEHGAQAPASIRAFEDTWNWAAARDTFDATLADPATPDRVRRALEALHDLLGASEMMTPRLLALHRVLKPTGSLYLHCDPTASHYLKIVLDTIFGPENFRNEITWKRRHGFSSAVHGSNRFGNCTDIIFFYAKSEAAEFVPQYNRDSEEYQAYIEKFFTLVDEHGRK